MEINEVSQQTQESTTNVTPTIPQIKQSPYKGVPKPRYKTDEERQKRNEEKKAYYREYYQQNKEKINKQNMAAWKKRRSFLKELGNNPEVLQFYNNLKTKENN